MRSSPVVVRRAWWAFAIAIALAVGEAHAFVPPSTGKPRVHTPWAGDWATSYGTLELAQSGKVVVGHYIYSQPPVRGEVRGEADGATLTFTWEEGKGGAGSGTGTFTLSADEQSFKGTWTVGNSKDPAGSWDGTKIVH